MICKIFSLVADPNSCVNEGECYDSALLHIVTAPSVQECQRECQDNQECEYFTWFQSDFGCLLFSDCNFNSTICNDCYTGSENCTFCFLSGICHNGHFVGYDFLESANDCLDLCKYEPECKWFGFDPVENNACYLTSDCPTIDANCSASGCVYGQVECQPSSFSGLNIMVATGTKQDVELDDTEVIDKVTITSCSNLPAKYPLEVERAVALQHDSKFVICGGHKEYNNQFMSDCYSYSNDQWSIEAFKLEPGRASAMSVEIRPGEWLVMGGLYDDGTHHYLSDTQLLKNGIFMQGPDLPEAIEGGSSVMLNETHLFVAAGRYQYDSPYYSSKNYLLHIDTDQGTQIADRVILSHSEYHSSGTFWNSTSGEIQIANVGRYGIEVYSPKDDSWHQVPYPSPLTWLFHTTTIQLGTDSFILIGGWTNLEDESGDIYLFDENGLSILKENVLQVSRIDHVAMRISKDEFICT